MKKISIFYPIKELQKISFLVCLMLLMAFSCVSTVSAYQLSGVKWPQPSTTFYVDIPGEDGLWNDAFEEAMYEWGAATVFQFYIVRGTYSDPCDSNDSRNGVRFASTDCGDEWGSTTIAICHWWYTVSTSTITEADIVFNSNESWNVYHTSWQYSVNDFKRVAVHELGHAIGLDHEDRLPSIMRTYAGNITIPQQDDINGIYELYGLAIPAPPILNSPAHNANAAGPSVNLSWSASTGATQYWLWVRRTSDNVVVISQNIGNNTSYNLTGLTNNGDNYFWMVRAGNNSGWSAWPTARRFYNGTAAIPAPPILNSPAHNANVAGPSANLSWSASTGATQYWLWVKRASDNVVIFNQSVGNTTSHSLTGLPNNGGAYFWMVRAYNSGGWSGWPVARRFFIGGASCTYSISSSSGSFTSSGGTTTVLVSTSNTSCAWIAYESLSWVSLSKTGGTGNGTVTVTVSANIGAARSGSITIAGKTYTISQAAPGYGYEGTWEGEMYPGVSISFEVEESGGAYYVKKATGTFYVSECNKHISWDSGGTLRVIISNNQCSMYFPDIQMELNITFDSKTESHGTWKSNETLCPGISIDGTFRAMRFVDDTAKQTIPVGRSPQSITISSDGAYVYVSNVGDNTLSVIQTSNNIVIDTISVGEKPGDIAVTPKGNFVYVTSPSSDSVSVIRTADNKVIDEISVVDPKALAFSLNGEYLYVTSCGDYITRHEYSKSTVTVIRTVDNSIVDEISVGDSPSQIALSPDGKYIYVTNSGSDAIGAQQPSISVVQTSDNSIVDTITSLLFSNPSF